MARIEQDELGELLSAYVDGELSSGEKSFVEKLLAEDATARELLEELRRTVDMTASLPRHSAPSTLVSDVQAMLERSALLEEVPRERVHVSRDRAPWAARLSLAAMVVLLVVGGWYFLQEPGRRGGAPVGSPVATREAAGAKESVPALSTRRFDEPVVSRVAGDRRTVDEKLNAGVELAALRSHSFEAEPVRLQLNVSAPKDAEALAERVTKKLTDEKLVNLASRPVDATASKGFYYRGDAGKNYAAANESQILVRATPTQIEQLLGEVAQAGQPDESATLVAGTLNVAGLQRSQSVLSALSPSPSNARQESAGISEEKAKIETDARKRDVSSDDFVSELIRIVGVDPSLLSKSKEAVDTSQPALVDSGEIKDEVEAKDRALGREVASAKGSLVGRRVASLEAKSAPPSVEPQMTVILQIVSPPGSSDKPSAPADRRQDPQPGHRNNSGRSSS